VEVLIMRRLVFGLALIPFVVACGGVSAGEGQLSTEPDGSQKVQKLSSPAGQGTSPKKQVSRSQSRSAPPSLPLSSAETYAAEHSADLPVSSPAKPASPTTNSWTGFYIGAGAGVGR
jgi:hypothetical protein